MDETMISQQLEWVDQRCKSNTHRLDEMEKRQDNLDKLMKAHFKESGPETATGVVAQ